MFSSQIDRESLRSPLLIQLKSMCEKGSRNIGKKQKYALKIVAKEPVQ